MKILITGAAGFIGFHLSKSREIRVIRTLDIGVGFFY